MTNPVKKLIKDILTETKSDPNLEKELLNNLTKETKEYYKILNNRAKDGQHIAKLELKMLKKKSTKTLMLIASLLKALLKIVIIQNHSISSMALTLKNVTNLLTNTRPCQMLNGLQLDR